MAVVMCSFCNRRRAGFKTKVTVFPHLEKDMSLCGICYKKYVKLREFYSVKAYRDIIEQVKKETQND